MYPPPAGTLGERSLPFDFKGREISPKVPVGAGLFVRDHSSWLIDVIREQERGVKVAHVRISSWIEK